MKEQMHSSSPIRVTADIRSSNKASRVPSYVAKSTLKETTNSSCLSKDKKDHFGGYDTEHDTPSLLAIVSTDTEEEVSRYDPRRIDKNEYNNDDNISVKNVDANASAQMKMATSSTSPIVVTDEEKDQTKKNSGSMHGRLGGKITRSGISSPGIATIRQRRQQRLQRRELDKELQELEREDDICLENDCKTSGGANDKNLLSVSHTKTIKLLKRHGADRARIPLSTTAGLSAGEGRNIDDAKQVTIHSNENCVSTMGRLRITQRQIPDGKACPSVEKCYPSRQRHKESGETLPFQNHDGHRQHEQRQKEVRMQPHTNSYDRPNEGHDDQDKCAQTNPKEDQNKFNIPGYVNEATSSTTPINIHNTRRIKEALARARSHRRGINESGADKIVHDLRTSCGGECYSGVQLKNHFEIGSEPCSISQISEDESTAAGDDDVTIITYMSETFSDDDEIDEEQLSQLSLPPELQAIAEQMVRSSSKVPSHCDKEESFQTQVEASTFSLSVDKYATAMSLDERNKDKKSLDTRLAGDGYREASVAMPMEGTISSSSALAKQLLEVRQRSRIKLNVYDLIADDTKLDLWGCHFPLGQVFNAVNSSLHSIGTGAYHVGLEINGIEYAYGANKTKGLTGIYTCMPKCSPSYQFRTTIDFGNRLVRRRKMNNAGNQKGEVVDGRQIVRQMATEYLGTDYDLLRKNCCTFAHDGCIRLGISEEEIPSWFHNLAAVGAVTQDATNSTLAPITQLFSSNELDKFADYLNETSLNDRLDAIENGPSEDRPDYEYVADTAYQY
jgi:hypothetical protein